MSAARLSLSRWRSSGAELAISRGVITEVAISRAGLAEVAISRDAPSSPKARSCCLVRVRVEGEGEGE